MIQYRDLQITQYGSDWSFWYEARLDWWEMRQLMDRTVLWCYDENYNSCRVSSPLYQGLWSNLISRDNLSDNTASTTAPSLIIWFHISFIKLSYHQLHSSTAGQANISTIMSNCQKVLSHPGNISSQWYIKGGEKVVGWLRCEYFQMLNGSDTQRY